MSDPKTAARLELLGGWIASIPEDMPLEDVLTVILSLASMVIESTSPALQWAKFEELVHKWGESYQRGLAEAKAEAAKSETP